MDVAAAHAMDIRGMNSGCRHMIAMRSLLGTTAGRSKSKRPGENRSDRGCMHISMYERLARESLGRCTLATGVTEEKTGVKDGGKVCDRRLAHRPR